MKYTREVKQIKVLVVVFVAVTVAMGVAMLKLANNRGKFVPGVDFAQPRHPVTPEMAKKVLQLNLKTAKLFKLKDSDGNETVIGGAGPKPQFIYAVKKGCPCSFDAEPLLQALYNHFGGRIEFIAVTDADQKDAHQWEKDLKVPYPVVSSSKVEVMQAYEYPASVYSSLVTTDGIIVKRWAGYSRGYLKEMNEQMSKLLNEPVRPFDAQYAPQAQTSGCSFEGYKPVFEVPQK